MPGHLIEKIRYVCIAIHIIAQTQLQCDKDCHGVCTSTKPAILMCKLASVLITWYGKHRWCLDGTISNSILRNNENSVCSS